MVTLTNNCQQFANYNPVSDAYYFLRIRLTTTRDLGNSGEDRVLYLHGKNLDRDTTHGCLCDKEEEIQNYFYNYCKSICNPINSMRNCQTTLLVIIIFLLGACSEIRTIPPLIDKSLIQRPIVPKEIIWHSYDSSHKTQQDLYAEFRTFYFANDSLVYAFDCINNYELVCIDTSFYESKTKDYRDSLICRYEDSILFGVENVVMHKGSYLYNGKVIVCILNGSNDTLTMVKKDNGFLFQFKGQFFITANNFEKESFNRLNDYLDLKQSSQ